MKRNYLSMFMCMLTLSFFSCSDTQIQVNGMESKAINIVDGNTVELQNGTKVVLLGIKPSSNSQKYLENHVKGRNVRVIADSRQPQYIKSNLTTVYAYLRVEGERGCVNNKLLLTRQAEINPNQQCDSLRSFSELIKLKRHPMMTTDQLLTYMKPATFCILTESGGMGTGFFISENGLALTNNHVLDGSEGAGVFFFGDDGTIDTSQLHYIKRIVKTYNDGGKIDYTIFIVDLDNNTKCQYLPLIEGRANDGEQIAKLGCPVGELGNFQTGILSNYNENYITHSIGANHGDSGGPVVNYRGEVVGINQSIQFNRTIGEQAKGIAYAVDALYIRQILDNMNIEYGR